MKTQTGSREHYKEGMGSVCTQLRVMRELPAREAGCSSLDKLPSCSEGGPEQAQHDLSLHSLSFYK